MREIGKESKGKVLVADDQFGIRLLLHEVLQSKGYEPLIASNGQQALEIFKSQSPHLVILDMKMPGMDGLDILKVIKEKKPNIKVIIMTAYAELNIIQEAIDNGAITCFSKPFDIKAVLEKVNEEICLKPF